MELDRLIYKSDWDNEGYSWYHNMKKIGWKHEEEEYFVNGIAHIYK